MLLDLHTHSVASDDSRATVEQYIKWANVLRRKGKSIDGFVLTEHRQFDHHIDYSNLASDSGLIILKGAELDTDTGHFLVYGISDEITNKVDFSDVNMSAQNLVDVCDTYGAIAIPAHPGRAGIGFAEYLEKGMTGFETVRTVEKLNGSNRPGEGEKAEALINAKGYHGTGGSDAHIVSAIGTCMTSFEKNIADEYDLVEQLRNGSFEAVKLDS
jgi:predicted metal-dependent phosphoesterase TrpH